MRESVSVDVRRKDSLGYVTLLVMKMKLWLMMR